MKKVAFILAMLMLLSCVACGGDEGEAVMVDSVASICGMGNVGLSNRFSGIVCPQGETKIKKSDESTVKEILVSVGDNVEEGQTLFTYDTDQISLSIESAQLELKKYRDTVASETSHKAELEAEKKEAPEDQQLEYTIQIQDVDTNIQEANYNISAKNKEIANLQKQLENGSVKSPVAGRVQSINENGGTDEAGNALPFMTVVQNDGYRIKGYISEANASALGEGTKVIAYSRVSDDTWTGTVSVVDLDNPKQNQSYTDDETAMSSKYPFYVELDTCDGLMLGQHVYVEISSGDGEAPDPNQINLPSYYISGADSKPWVWAQNSRGKLEKRSITLGDYNADFDTYVVEDGLTAEDYITAPDERLSEGMTCTVYEPVEEENQGNSEADMAGGVG